MGHPLDDKGVTVEQDGSKIAFYRFCNSDQPCIDYLSAAEADALLRGLLRWKLEKEGVLETELFFDRAVVQFNREGSR